MSALADLQNVFFAAGAAYLLVMILFVRAPSGEGPCLSAGWLNAQRKSQLWIFSGFALLHASVAIEAFATAGGINPGWAAGLGGLCAGLLIAVRLAGRPILLIRERGADDRIFDWGR